MFRAADDERRQAKRNSLAEKLTVETKALADLKIEKAAVEGERRRVSVCVVFEIEGAHFLIDGRHRIAAARPFSRNATSIK